MHRRTPSDDEMLSGGGLHARHPSWSGLPTDYGVDLEEACCRNRARSHSHDVSHDPRLRRRRQVLVHEGRERGGEAVAFYDAGEARRREVLAAIALRRRGRHGFGARHLTINPLWPG